MTEAEKSCGLFHCPLGEAYTLMPSIPWGDIPFEDDDTDDPLNDYIVDVKIHKLMPEQWPCIPNWHCDFIPRDPNTLVEDYSKANTDRRMFMWLSGPPLTEFKDGRKIIPKTWEAFTQADMHRGMPAIEHCWRTFVRVAPIDIVMAGLPKESIPAPPDQWIRRHAQVYLDVNKFKW
jgi:hypothetical protein